MLSLRRDVAFLFRLICMALIGASGWLGSGRDFDHPPIISVASRSWQHLAQWHKINPQNPQRIATVQPDPTVAEMTQNPKSLRVAFLHVINLTCSRRCCIRHVDGLKFKVYLPTILKKQSLESFCFFFDTETFRNVRWTCFRWTGKMPLRRRHPRR